MCERVVSHIDRETVLVALSGGVDSSVAALLLHEQGYRVVGGMMRLWAEEGGPPNRCCSPEAEESARELCRRLGVPFHLFDFEAEFKRDVVDYFVDEYARGRTPNPCLACNRHIKFGLLLEKAIELGAEYLATGHYARIRRAKGQCQLLRGVDRGKDQSYVLHTLGQRELARLLFPLGERSKDWVQALAGERDLPAAGREESQEVCFTMGDYRRFLVARPEVVLEPGPILDEKGRVLGEHKGLPAYTIGQRGGLGVAAPHPLYVLEIDTEHNALMVGPRQSLARQELRAGGVHFVSGRGPTQPADIQAQIRYRAPAARARLTYDGRQALVQFARPQAAVTPGQAVVFYDGDLVLGGGIIEEAK